MSEGDTGSIAVEDMNVSAPPTVQMADERYHKGIQAVKNHQFVEALHHFSKAVFLASGEPLPYIARAEAYMHLHDLKSAISNYRKALTLMKDPVAAADLRVRLAQVLDTQGIASFRARDTPCALMYAEESIGTHRTNIAELHKVLYLIDAGDDDGAERLLSSVLVHEEEVMADAASLLIQLHISRRQDFATSKRLLEDVLFRHSRNPRVLDAEKFFDESFAKFRESAEARLDIDALSKCVLAFPEDAELYKQRAVAYSNKKMFSYAVQDVFSCITKSGGANDEASSMMKSILAAIATELVEVGDMTAAVNYFGEALKWDEKAVDVLLSRGDCYVSLSKHEEALRDFKSVLVMDDANEPAKERLCNLYDFWGSVFYNDGKYELAEAEFTRAILVHDERPMPYYHRAMARLMLQKQAYAVRDLMSCKILGVDDPDAVKMINQFCGNYVPSSPASVAGSSASLQTSSVTSDTPARSVRSYNTVKASRPPVPSDPLDDLRKSSVIQPQAAHGSTSLLTPAGLRDSLTNVRGAADSSIVVTFNPISQGKTVHYLNRDGNVHSTVREKNGVCIDDGLKWQNAQKRQVQRFVAVSQAEPVPSRYVRNAPSPCTPIEQVASSCPETSSDAIPVVRAPTVSHQPRGGVGSVRITSHATPHSISSSAPERFIFSKKIEPSSSKSTDVPKK